MNTKRTVIKYLLVIVVILACAFIIYQLKIVNNMTLVISSSSKEYEMYIHKNWSNVGVYKRGDSLYVSHFFYPWPKNEILGPYKDTVEYRGFGVGVVYQFVEGDLYKVIGISDEGVDGVSLFELRGNASLMGNTIVDIVLSGITYDNNRYEYALSRIDLENSDRFQVIDSLIIDHFDEVSESSPLLLSGDEWSSMING